MAESSVFFTARWKFQAGVPVSIDVLDFPQAPSYLSTFSASPASLGALVEILARELELAGVNPLPGLVDW
jgi:hypothetical protein